jgi:hypothetical protein
MIIRVLISKFDIEHRIACKQQRLKLWWVYWSACSNIAVWILTDTITKNVCVFLSCECSCFAFERFGDKGGRSAFAVIYIAKTEGCKGANRRFLENFCLV